MNGIRSETQYHTAEQVTEYVGGALAIVESLEVPDDLRAAVFGKAADLLAQKHIEVSAVVAPDGLAGLLGRG